MAILQCCLKETFSFPSPVSCEQTFGKQEDRVRSTEMTYILFALRFCAKTWRQFKFDRKASNWRVLAIIASSSHVQRLGLDCFVWIKRRGVVESWGYVTEDIDGINIVTFD
jgi:hypothetical protein